MQQGQLLKIGHAVLNAHKARRKPRGDLRKNARLVVAGKVGFVDEQYAGHAVLPAEQLKQRGGVRGYGGRAVDHQHGHIQNGKRALGFGGKIGVARRIHQGKALALPGKPGLVGKYRDAAGALDFVGIQQRIAMINPARRAGNARTVEQLLGQRGFARVHMGQNPHGKRPGHEKRSFPARGLLEHLINAAL